MTTNIQAQNAVLLAQIQQAKEQNLLEDQSQDTFVSRTIPEGKAVGRLIGYVELGLQPQTFNGKPTEPAEEVMITFELHNPPWAKEAGFSYEVDEKDADGKPTGKKIMQPTRMTIRLAKKFNPKSKYRKLWKKLTEGKSENTNVILLMGESYLFDVKHEVSKKDPQKKFATLYADGTYNISRPIVLDMVQGELQIPVPAVTLPMQVFLQSMPTKEQWQTIFIDGEREVEKDGVKSMQSKNYIQETILKSLNYRGSRLELMLTGNQTALDAIAKAHETPAVAVSAPASTPAPAAAQQTVVAPAQEGAPLAAPTQAAVPVEAAVTAPAQAPTVTSTASPVVTGTSTVNSAASDVTTSSNAADDVAAAMEAMFGPQA